MTLYPYGICAFNIVPLLCIQYFSVKVMDSMKAGSFKTKQTVCLCSICVVITYYTLQFYIDPYKLLPLSRFLPQPKGTYVGMFVHVLYCFDDSI